ncbi:hypothetical protein KC323_g312 [Hortaea werneckii]|nr:hypothetical protein KC323_g312 [Hortaea werneckii]
MLRGSLLIASNPRSWPNPQTFARLIASQGPLQPTAAFASELISNPLPLLARISCHISNLFPLLTASDKVLNLKKNDSRMRAGSYAHRPALLLIYLTRRLISNFFGRSLYGSGSELSHCIPALPETSGFAVGACRPATMKRSLIIVRTCLSQCGACWQELEIRVSRVQPCLGTLELQLHILRR